MQGYIRGYFSGRIGLYRSIFILFVLGYIGTALMVRVFGLSFFNGLFVWFLVVGVASIGTFLSALRAAASKRERRVRRVLGGVIAILVIALPIGFLAFIISALIEMQRGLAG